jgi:hypothetical protein
MLWQIAPLQHWLWRPLVDRHQAALVGVWLV